MVLNYPSFVPFAVIYHLLNVRLQRRPLLLCHHVGSYQGVPAFGVDILRLDDWIFYDTHLCCWFLGLCLCLGFSAQLQRISFELTTGDRLGYGVRPSNRIRSARRFTL